MQRRKLVDPIHVFDAKGRSVLSYEELERRNVMQERQIARLVRMLRRQKAHNGADAGETARPDVLH